MDKSNDLDFMKEYLFNVMNFEKYVYTWNNALESANNMLVSTKTEKEETDADVKRTKNYLADFNNNYKRRTDTWESEKRKKTTAFIFELVLLVSLVILYVWLNQKFNDSDGTILFFFIVPCVALIIGLLNSGIYIKDYTKYCSSEEKKKTKQAYVDYLKEKETSLIRVENKLCFATQKRIDIEKNLNEAKAVLAEMYSHDVIPECYKNFVAVSTMYQYIDTGRCVCIKGHGGIYDTYENDYRMKLIITNLQRISEKLDAIIENQNILYQQMKEANATLNSINREVQSINEKASHIEENTAVAAFAQQQTYSLIRYNSNICW